MNKAIENRVCINLRRMSWAEPPRTMFLVEKSDGWRTGSEGRRLSQQAVLGTPFACCTSTKVQILTQTHAVAAGRPRYSICLLYWCKSTNTDRIIGTKVQILTHAVTGIGAHLPLLGTKFACFPSKMGQKYKY